MSHRPPQPPGNMYGFQMQGAQPPVSQDDPMMGLVDPAMFSTFGSNMSMSLDENNNVIMSARPFQRSLAPDQPGAATSAMSPQTAPGAPIMPSGPGGHASIPGPSDQRFARPVIDDKMPPPMAMTNNSYGAMQQPHPSSLILPPHSLGAAIQPGSTLTEYTKKRDWAARTVEELADMQQILDQDGVIRHISPSVTALTGWTREEMMNQLLQDLIHPDDVGVYLSEMNEAAATGGTVRLFYRLRKKDESWGVFEAVGHAHIAGAKFSSNPHNQSHFRQAVFLMSRPYPTKNAELLDSFLEHKIENERLRRRIAELRKEEYEDGGEDAQRNWQDGRSERTSEDATGSVSTSTTARRGPQPSLHGGMGVLSNDGSAAAILNSALTRENLEGAIAGSRQDSINDKMARYEGGTTAEQIEIMTGLRFNEGERRHGTVAGAGQPMTKGDAGIAIPMDRDARAGADKKKKLKVAEEYVCTDCGTLDSPEWRKGPSGPKTLCNACGLRWAKKEKKRNAKAGTGAPAPPGAPALVHH